MARVTTNSDPVNLDHDDNHDEGFGDGENDNFFSSLYDTLIIKGSSSSCPSSPHLRPNLRFEFYGGEEWVEAHLVVMAHWCLKLPHVLLKGEDGGLICGVPASLGVSPESYRIFRQAIYLKKLPSRSLTFKDRMQVRRLAEHFGCRMVLKKCDDVQVSLKNCHILWDKDKWPEGSEVRKNALTFIKWNLKTLVEKETCLDWTEELWITVLSLNDLSPPCPTEEDLFRAALKWHTGKNSSTVDSAKFRSLFRDLFRYHLMSSDFLLMSDEFEASGVLENAELIDVLKQQKGREGVTNFTKIPRTLTAAPSPMGTASSSFTNAVGSSANSSKRKRGASQNLTPKPKKRPKATSGTRSSKMQLRGKPEDEDRCWQEQCMDLLNDICHKTDAQPFRQPVDIIAYPGYYQVIDTPMDLGSVREDLLGRNYRTGLDFHKDMMLIFSNAKQFNLERSPLYAMTLRLQSLYECRMKPLLTKWRKKSGSSSSNVPYMTRGASGTPRKTLVD